MRLRDQFSLWVAIGVVLSGCGIKLPPTMPVPLIPPVEAKSEWRKVKDAALYVEEIADLRPESFLAEQGAQRTAPASDISLRVREAMKAALRDRGFVIDESAPVVVNGKVKRWRVTINSGNASAEAEIATEIVDPTGRKIYSGNYQGYATIESSSLKIEDVSGVLGSALANALAQMVSDKRFIELAASF